MAGLKIEGDLAQISDVQLKFIQSVIEKLGYTENKVTIEPIGQAGDNYVANVKRVIVEDGKGGTFKMVAKVAPTLEQLRMMANTQPLFRNEHIMYTKVLPQFTELEVAAEVPPQERLRYAKCYGSLSEPPNEVILLEDLKESNFVMLDRFKSISNECVKSVLKNFASYHSLSYALKYKKPLVFDELKNNLFDMWAVLGQQEEIVAYFQQMEMNAINTVESDQHKKALTGSISGAMKELSKMAKNEKENKHAVIQQGDSWTNNIMFKMDGENVTESIMIDYQLSKPTNPSADILYMVFNCTDHQLRKQHYHDWIDYYHTELDKALSNYGLKANFVFPRDQLDADLKRFGKANFGLSVMLAGVLSLNTEEASAMKEMMNRADMEEMKQNVDKGIGLTNTESIAIYKKRLEDLVVSHIEFGLIPA